LAGTHWQIGRKPSRAFGWILPTLLVAAAVFGPPLTGQSITALVELRNDILMIDRELERWSIRTNTAFAGTSTLVRDDPGGAGGARSKIQFRGGVS
jgi:hypothetical protein